MNQLLKNHQHSINVLEAAGPRSIGPIIRCIDPDPYFNPSDQLFNADACQHVLIKKK